MHLGESLLDQGCSEVTDANKLVASRQVDNVPQRFAMQEAFQIIEEELGLTSLEVRRDQELR